MFARLMYSTAGIVALGALAFAQTPASSRHHFNPMIDLLAQKQPVFGLYRPSAGGNRGRGRAETTAPPERQKTPVELVKEMLANGNSDFVFDGSMEGGVDRAIGRRSPSS